VAWRTLHREFPVIGMGVSLSGTAWLTKAAYNELSCPKRIRLIVNKDRGMLGIVGCEEGGWKISVGHSPVFSFGKSLVTQVKEVLGRDVNIPGKFVGNVEDVDGLGRVLVFVL
jgi:hypothetical protein